MKLIDNSRILIDANILINDFFFRQPDFGLGRIVPERREQVEAYRAKVHQTLVHLSSLSSIQVFVPSFVLLRIASLLSDLFVPNELARQELIYLTNNYTLIDVDSQSIEEIMWQIQKTEADDLLDMEDYFLLLACRKAECNYLLTSTNKGYSSLEEVKIIRPDSYVEND